MKTNILAKEVYDDIIVYKDILFSNEVLQKARDTFEEINEKRIIEGKFDDSKWTIFNEVHRVSVFFTIQNLAYEHHGKKVIGFPISKAEMALRCLATTYVGEFIAETIDMKIKGCIKFLETVGEENCSLYSEEVIAVEDFLKFIGMPIDEINLNICGIRDLGFHQSSVRELSNIMNYMVINNEINRIISEASEEIFIRWFPIYFWTNVTFILPLRATETMLTPYECITHKGEKTYITVHRTILKKALRQVGYTVEEDYRKYTYEIRESTVTKNIERYAKLTKEHTRDCLFDYNEKTVKNGHLSLESFNRLLADFINENIVGNSYYDFARYTADLDEFEVVTAGDSRPLAMSNLYFQDIPADLCRQLAGHVNVDTSTSYIMNVKETMRASSTIRLINRTKANTKIEKTTLPGGYGKCTSLKRMANDKDISDCPPGNYLDCFGCPYYRMGEKDIDNYILNEDKKAEEAIRKVFSCIKEIQDMKGGGDIDQLFTIAQTYITRLGKGYDYKANEDYKAWEEKRNSQKTTC